MKKIKFMLVALMAVFGFSSAFAQAIGDPFEYGNYKYTITKVATANSNGTAKIMGLTDAAKLNANTDGDEAYITFSGSGANRVGELEFPAQAQYLGKKYIVTEMASETFKNVAYYATKVTIPASLIEIPTAAFNTLTNLNTIVFAENSEVKKIGAQAFASTRITEFNFTNCEELEGLNDEVFVERCTAEQREANEGLNPNVNSYITKVTVPTSPKFKHINGAFRNLTELKKIDGLEESWIQEVVEGAFANTKIGIDEALVLPEKDLLYIDQDALKGSKVQKLTIKMGTVLYVGGCDITYVQDGTTGEYTYTYTVLEEPATTNLYGFERPDEQTPAAKIAPLTTLTLTGTQRGKICTNAFLGCTNLNGLDLKGLFYGSKAQFETSAFEYCPLIEALTINPLSNNETDGYTFEKEAFKDCPIATLTMLGVNTAKAVNTEAFGKKLKKVTIGTVDATGAVDAPAFADGAFTFGAVSGAELFLATGQGEFLNSKDAQNAIIASGAFDFNAVRDYEVATGETMVYPVVTIGEIKSKGAVFAAGAIEGPVQKMEFTGNIARNGLTVGGADATPAGVRILNENLGERETSYFKTLIFGVKCEIETNGIGSGAFAGFDELTSVTFNGLLSELAVASGAFEGSGKVTEGFIGSKQVAFVKYTKTGIQNWAVNPFASDAFTAATASQEAGNAIERIIWWQVDDPTLKKEILGAIQKAIKGDAYDGKVYSTKFNVFKWVDIEMTTPDIEGPHFLFFQDLKNDNKIAWGRYDLGSFEVEKGKYSTLPETDPNYIPAYEATDMVIPRFQTTTGAKVKLTLYGLYYDEDDFEQVSTTYLVPLRVWNGTYQISSENTHVIIGKAEIQSGSFTDKDVKIYYNNVVAEDQAEASEGEILYDAAWTNNPEDPDDEDAVTEEYDEDHDAVWEQLKEEGRVYTKATEADAKTHEELYDAVIRHGADEATDVVTKDIWNMTDPAKYKGFRIDKNPVTKDNYTFIGEGWYYALLNNYNPEDAAAPARVIWLDEAQATAIFGVKGVDVKESLRNDNVIYNLQGVRVSKPGKGLYIQNGKKFIVK